MGGLYLASLSRSCTLAGFHLTSRNTSIILGSGMEPQRLLYDGPCMPWVVPGSGNSIPQLDNSFGIYRNYTSSTMKMILPNILRRVVRKEAHGHETKAMVRLEDQRTQVNLGESKQSPTKKQRTGRGFLPSAVWSYFPYCHSENIVHQRTTRERPS